ncbi:MAG: CvpA family protein [Lachnospiraceae bacterium]|nr:CvpA family protein [Lachnospiraceae bacterium]
MSFTGTEMNIMLIIILAIMALSMFKGYRDGFLRSAFSVVSWLIAIVLVTAINPQVTSFIENNTQIDDSIASSVEDYLKENGLKSLEGENYSEMTLSADMSDTEIGNIFGDALQGSGLELPESALDFLTDGAIESVEGLVEESGVYKVMAENISHFIIKGIAFLITWIIVWFVLLLIENSLNLVSYIPVLGTVNRTLGIIAGAFKVLLLIWIFFYIVSLCCTTEFGAVCISQIRSSAILTWLYENNLLLRFVVGLFA